ncbi:MAG: protease modulator HflC [Alphaproteobacteria bacterium]|nr:MAG: protease modulator HflC [Alphaproteobacteria bacterium]
MTKSFSALIVVGFLAFIGVTQSFFIVPETHQVLVLRFGDPVRQHAEPGLKVKIPFLEQMKTFDKRVLNADPPPEELILLDQKRLVVDTFARYKITDMLLFHQTMGTEGQASKQLHNIINSTVRGTLGNKMLPDILGENRTNVMAAIKEEVNNSVQRFGMSIIDVRIGRADFPQQISQSIYARMRSERDREAKEFRAQGSEIAQQIMSRADKERTLLLAEARKKSQILRGEGDEKAIKIYADAYKVDPEFYAFYRTLQAYRESLAGKDTTLVLSPDSEFFNYFGTSGKKK